MGGASRFREVFLNILHLETPLPGQFGIKHLQLHRSTQRSHGLKYFCNCTHFGIELIINEKSCFKNPHTSHLSYSQIQTVVRVPLFHKQRNKEKYRGPCFPNQCESDTRHK
jgi:hypothetical protein